MSLPPLRDRREDIPYLTAAFIKTTAARLNKPLSGITAPAERLLVSARWDGNVRELRNVLERACILADGEFITERELAGAGPIPPAVRAPGEPETSIGSLPVPAQPLPDTGREHIVRAMERVNGNKRQAAQMLGLSRRALYRLLERHSLGHTINRRKELPVGI